MFIKHFPITPSIFIIFYAAVFIALAENNFRSQNIIYGGNGDNISYFFLEERDIFKKN